MKEEKQQKHICKSKSEGSNNNEGVTERYVNDSHIKDDEKKFTKKKKQQNHDSKFQQQI